MAMKGGLKGRKKTEREQSTRRPVLHAQKPSRVRAVRHHEGKMNKVKELLLKLEAE